MVWSKLLALPRKGSPLTIFPYKDEPFPGWEEQLNPHQKEYLRRFEGEFWRNPNSTDNPKDTRHPEN